MTSTGRVARLTALALATGTLVAAGGSTASAATPVADKLALAANTGGNVLRIEANLPEGISVPGVGSQIVQTLSLSDGEIANGTALKGLSHAALGKGTLTDLVTANLPLELFPEATSTLASPAAVSKGLINIDEPGLRLKVLPTESRIADPNKVTNGVLSESHTALDNIRVEAPNLAANLPIALDDVLDLVETVTATATSTAPAGEVAASVDSAIGALNQAAGQNVVADNTAAAAVDTLTQTLTGLQKLAANVKAADSSLVSISQLTSDQTVVRTNGLVSASSTNALTSVSLLGGLITVDALKSGVTSSVDTVAKKANVAYLPESNQIVKVSIKGVADLILDSTGIHLDGLPADLGPVTDTVNGAVAELLAAINLLGIQVTSGKNATPTYAPDGSGASGAASGAGITVNPLGAAKPLLALSFVNSAAGVSAKVIDLPTTKTSSKASDSVTVSTLPRTGANLGLTGIAAAGLIGLAMVARRRRMAHIAE